MDKSKRVEVCVKSSEKLSRVLKQNNTLFSVSSYGISDIGLVRLTNEDVWAQMLEEKFFILADGMGGHSSGEIAANETVVHLCQFIKSLFRQLPLPDLEALKEKISQAIVSTNRWVYELAAKETEMQGMGTTLCLALVYKKYLIYANVGDSRIYQVRRGRMTQLTHDHSLRAELIAKGELDEVLASSFPYKNVITRAIGTQSSVLPELNSCPVELNDIYFLCSDGLTDRLNDKQILRIIRKNKNIKEASEELIQEAKNQGGDDNITILIFKIT